MLKHLNRAEEYLAVALLGLMSLLVFSQVVLRFFFGLGYGWVDELARVSFIWVVFLGAVVGMQRGLHLRVTIGLKALPERLRPAAAILSELLLLIFCLTLAWHGLELVLSTLEFSFTLPSTGLSMFYPYLIMPISFALQALRIVMRHASGEKEPGHV